jgi:hypothetical protein
MLTTLNPELRTPLGGLFENAALINLLHGKPAKKTIFTWKKDSKTNIEVDFVLNSKELKQKIPIECKAALVLKRKHFTNLLHYLRLGKHKLGVLISAAPLQVVSFDDGINIINIPIYLATEKNIRRYVLRAI